MGGCCSAGDRKGVPDSSILLKQPVEFWVFSEASGSCRICDEHGDVLLTLRPKTDHDKLQAYVLRDAEEAVFCSLTVESFDTVVDGKGLGFEFSKYLQVSNADGTPIADISAHVAGKKEKSNVIFEGFQSKLSFKGRVLPVEYTVFDEEASRDLQNTDLSGHKWRSSIFDAGYKRKFEEEEDSLGLRVITKPISGEVAVAEIIMLAVCQGVFFLPSNLLKAHKEDILKGRSLGGGLRRRRSSGQVDIGLVDVVVKEEEKVLEIRGADGRKLYIVSNGVLTNDKNEKVASIKFKPESLSDPSAENIWKVELGKGTQQKVKWSAQISASLVDKNGISLAELRGSFEGKNATLEVNLEKEPDEEGKEGESLGKGSPIHIETNDVGSISVVMVDRQSGEEKDELVTFSKATAKKDAKKVLFTCALPTNKDAWRILAGLLLKSLFSKDAFKNKRNLKLSQVGLASSNGEATPGLEQGLNQAILRAVAQSSPIWTYPKPPASLKYVEGSSDTQKKFELKLAGLSGPSFPSILKVEHRDDYSNDDSWKVEGAASCLLLNSQGDLLLKMEVLSKPKIALTPALKSPHATQAVFEGRREVAMIFWEVECEASISTVKGEAVTDIRWTLDGRCELQHSQKFQLDDDESYVLAEKGAVKVEVFEGEGDGGKAGTNRAKRGKVVRMEFDEEEDPSLLTTLHVKNVVFVDDEGKMKIEKNNLKDSASLHGVLVGHGLTKGEMFCFSAPMVRESLGERMLSFCQEQVPFFLPPATGVVNEDFLFPLDPNFEAKITAIGLGSRSWGRAVVVEGGKKEGEEVEIRVVSNLGTILGSCAVEQDAEISCDIDETSENLVKWEMKRKATLKGMMGENVGTLFIIAEGSVSQKSLQGQQTDCVVSVHGREMHLSEVGVFKGEKSQAFRLTFPSSLPPPLGALVGFLGRVVGGRSVLFKLEDYDQILKNSGEQLEMAVEKGLEKRKSFMHRR